jgi:nucleotide-binding universal stress UspA family protein
MYKKIMVPVDLAHKDKLDKALGVAADLAKHFDASVCFVGVTANPPSSVAHSAEEYAEKLDAFAAEQSQKSGLEITTKTVVSHDPARDLDDTLGKAAHELGSDLIVMASHVPNFAEHIFASNAGYLANHIDTSVFIVR